MFISGLQYQKAAFLEEQMYFSLSPGNGNSQIEIRQFSIKCRKVECQKSRNVICLWNFIYVC